MNCNECRWFKSQKKDLDRSETGTWRAILVGHCRKHPPQRFDLPENKGTISGWPNTCGNDWCGEWEYVIDDSFSRAPLNGAGPGRRWSDWIDDLEQTYEVNEKVKTWGAQGRHKQPDPGDASKKQLGEEK